MGSFTGNNLFLVSVTLLFFNDPGAFASLNSLIAVVLFFPLSGDPLRLVPADRLRLWPLTARGRMLIRVASPLLSPMTWVVLALALWKGVSRGLWLLVGGLFVMSSVASALPRRGSAGWRRVPAFGGRWREIVRLSLRQMLSTLDFYAALLLSAAAAFFRWRGVLAPDGFFPLTMLVLLAFSTVPQCLFGLDGAGGITRYRLLPLPGRQVLLAKDAAYLALALALTAPLSPLCGLAGALVLLAAGRPVAVRARRTQARWRFQAGDSFGISLLQVGLMAAACAGVNAYGAAVVLPCAGAYCASTWWYGRILFATDGNR